MKKPFIFIAGVMRTGTTLLQEMFTRLPESYMFHEPWFGQGKFLNKDLARTDLAGLVDLEREIAKNNSVPELFESLNQYVGQLGVKEIRLRGSMKYLNWFPNSRVILTGRDPRDIYLSCHYKLLRGDKSWTPMYSPFCPEALLAEVYPDWNKQKEIDAVHKDVLKLKYEDLVRQADWVWSVLADVVDSPLKEPGEIGAFHKKIERGKYETKVHKGKITDKASHRWENEQDFNALEKATKFADLLGQTGYLDFWGYTL